MRSGSPAPIVLGLVVALGLAIYTTHKLHKMARIRGLIGDVPVEQHVVARKAQQPGRRTVVCFLWWRDDPPHGPEHRVQADCDYWKQVRIGDPIEIVRPDGSDDDDVYLRRGEIYASDGNFRFDFVLLAAELGAVGYCAYRLLRGAARRRRDSRA
ncbi:MAG TPA: hypothetical protein VF469_33265 [Kofleriaceae bacterium]